MDEIKKLSGSATIANGTAPAYEKGTAPANAKGTASVKFSVKMRLGQNSADEAFALLPILNDTPLAHITIHPRLGKQQYKGVIDFNSFERFYNESKLPIVYNGDITTVSQICELAHKYPKLMGVMIGRGLLANPELAAEYKSNNAAHSQTSLSKVLKMHQVIFENACSTYQGDSQIISHIQSFWEYLEPHIPKKIFKKIKKASKLIEYNEAISALYTEHKVLL